MPSRTSDDSISSSSNIQRSHPMTLRSFISLGISNLPGQSAASHSSAASNIVAATNLLLRNASAIHLVNDSAGLLTKPAVDNRGEKTMTRRIKDLLGALPPLVMEKMPVPTSPRLEKFEYFERLPVELRRMIYVMMMDESRCIKLFEGPGRKTAELIYPWDSNVEGQSRHPVIVHLSREARAEGLRTYTICHDRARIFKKRMTSQNQSWFFDTLTASQTMSLFESGKRNTYFIAFDRDYFSHGQSRLPLRGPQIPGPADFNFKIDVLSKVQNVYQQPCYKDALSGFHRIDEDTINTAILFRHKLWQSLQHVTIVTEEYSALNGRETVFWAHKTLKYEAETRLYVKTKEQAPGKPLKKGKSSWRHIGPMQFQLHFMWKRPFIDDIAPCAARTQKRSTAEKRAAFILAKRDVNRETLRRCAELYCVRGD